MAARNKSITRKVLQPEMPILEDSIRILRDISVMETFTFSDNTSVPVRLAILFDILLNYLLFLHSLI